MDLRSTLTYHGSKPTVECPVLSNKTDCSVMFVTSPFSYVRFRYYYFIIIYTNLITQFPFNYHPSKLEYPAPSMWCEAVVTTFILLSSVLESVLYFMLQSNFVNLAIIQLFNWSCLKKLTAYMDTSLRYISKFLALICVSYRDQLVF